MAKAKKNEASDAGATKKQATGTKKAAAASADDGEGAAKPKATTKAASTTKAAASTTRPAGGAGASTGGPTKKKAAAKPAAAAQSPGSVPLIDTSLAAQAAAQFVMNRALIGGATAGAAQPPAEGQAEPQGREKRESSAFKQLKAGLNKPASQGLNGVLGNADPNRKGNTGFGGGNRQVGRNQTFGADVNRSGVPRRTGG